MKLLNQYDLEALDRVFEVAMRDNSILPSAILKMTELRNLFRNAKKVSIEEKDRE